MQTTRLEKRLKPSHVAALALGAILGWGNFILPEAVFLPRSGILGSTLGFLVGGILMSIIAIVYGYMIKKFPVAGGDFAYAYAGYGPTIAFICGWGLLLGYISIICANLMGLVLIFRALTPGLFTIGELYTIAGWPVFLGEILFFAGVMMLFAYMNYRGASIAGGVQVILAISLVTGILVLFFGSVTNEASNLANLEPILPEGKTLLPAMLAIIAIAPWLFIGFDTVPQVAEEVNFSPAKTRALMLFSIGVGAVLYMLTTFSVAIFIPQAELPAALAKTGAPFGTAYVAEAVFGKFGRVVLGVAMLGAVLSGLNGFLMAGTRLILSMGRGCILPNQFAKVHEKYGTPYVAIIFVLIAALISLFFGRAVVTWLVDMSATGTALAYFTTSLVAAKAMRYSGESKLTIPYLGAILSVMCFLLLVIPGSPAFMPEECWYALFAWIALGILFYMTTHHRVKATPKSELNTRILGVEKNSFFPE